MLDERSRTARSAVVIMLSMIVSRILGFVRDMILYAKFGQGHYTDAYNAAFSIPDAIYMILVGGAFSAAFIPVFSSYMARDRGKEAWEVASITLTFICMAMVFLITLAFIFAPQLVSLITSAGDGSGKGFTPATTQLTITLTRIMLLQVVFMALAGVCSGILQSYKIFGPTAVGGVVYNVGIIVIGVAFSSLIERAYPNYGIAAFSIGVVAGALGNLLIQGGALRRVGMHFRPSFQLRHPGFVKIVVLMIPVLIGLSANEVNLLVNLKLGSSLEAGLLSALKTAQRCMQLPISIFAISIAMTLFPVLTQAAAQSRMADFRRDYAGGIRTILFICIPSSILLCVLGKPFVRLLFEAGDFTPVNTANTAFALYFYAIGIFAQGCIHLTSRAFYALQNTAIPVIMAVIGSAVNIVLSVLLIKVLAQGGLALAYSIAGIVNLVLLIFVLRRRVGHIYGHDILRSALQTLGISCLMAIASWLFAAGSELLFGVASKWAQAVQLVGGGIVGVTVFLILAKLLRMPEAETFLRSMRRRFKPKR